MNFGRDGDMCHALFEWLRCHVILITVTLVCLKVKELPLKVGIVILHIQYLNTTKNKSKYGHPGVEPGLPQTSKMENFAIKVKAVNYCYKALRL